MEDKTAQIAAQTGHYTELHIYCRWRESGEKKNEEERNQSSQGQGVSQVCHHLATVCVCVCVCPSVSVWSACL